MKKFTYPHKVSCTELRGFILLDGLWIGNIKSGVTGNSKLLWYRYINVTRGDADSDNAEFSKPIRNKSEAIRQLLISWYAIAPEMRRGLYPNADHESVAFHHIMNVTYVDRKGNPIEERFENLTLIIGEIMEDHARLTGLLDQRRSTALPQQFSPSNTYIFDAIQKAEDALRSTELHTVLVNYRYLITTRKWKQ